MEIRKIDIKELNEAGYNPRVELIPGMPEYEKLKTSIETFGNVEPIVWNSRTGHVVGGHQRLTALKDLGHTQTTVSVVDLNERDEKLLSIALNKIKGQWDYAQLEEILSGFEFDEAKLSGFSAQEISLILARNDDIEYALNDEDCDASDFLGASWVITLKFTTQGDAQKWLKTNGHDSKTKAKAGNLTTVIRMA